MRQSLGPCVETWWMEANRDQASFNQSTQIRGAQYRIRNINNNFLNYKIRKLPWPMAFDDTILGKIQAHCFSRGRTNESAPSKFVPVQVNFESSGKT